MTEKELLQARNKPQSITNILDDDFDITWDWMDYTVKKGETINHPYYLAEHIAFHMARKYCYANKIDFTKEWGKIVDKIMSKKFIDYNKLTKAKAVALAKERNISVVQENWRDKTLAQLRDDLKDSH